MKLKELYPTCTIIVICAIIATIQAASAVPTISVEPSSQTVSSGENFTVDIYVTPEGNVTGGVAYVLYFDNTLLSATSLVSGTFFSGYSVNTYGEGINNSTGTIDYCESIQGSGGVTTDGTLTTITFQAIADHGTSELRLDETWTELGDPDGMPITINTGEGSVRIAGDEPPTTPFLISGYVFNEDESVCNDPAVTITNLNTGKEWTAEKDASSNYYQLTLVSGADVIADAVLRFNVTSLDGSSNSIEHTVTPGEVGEGGLFDFNLTLGSTGDPKPSLVTYTISNSIISPNGDGVMDNTTIDVKFSESVAATITIENATGVVKALYTGSGVIDPDPQVWDGTDDSGNTVAYGTYQVKVTMDDGVNPVVIDDTKSIIVADMSVAIISIGDGVGNVTLPIEIENGVDVGACDITLTFDPAVVNVTNVTGGDMDITVANLECVHEGLVRIGTYQSGNQGLSGEITFANVVLEPVNGGNCSLNLSVVTFKDATPVGNQMPYIVRNGTYTGGVTMNGDVNGNGIVDIHDAMYLAKYMLKKPGFTTIDEEAADVNGDGKITSYDAMYLAKHVVGISGYEELK